ncbi:MAG TPA: hypothetical protein ENJ44_01010 [Oceanospirillales bacterium]|nr:hypothetical protein [Oceanospirillales bacterium]
MKNKKRIKFITFLMFGALFCSIMVAVTKLMGADDYTGMFAIAAVGFAIVTLPFSVIVHIEDKKTSSISRVDLLRQRILEEKS